MSETSARFKAGDGISIEGRIGGDLEKEAWIICHPHPLYGGSMNNNVVFAARDTFLELGFGTLRFNFRGVGASEGSFGDGRGEALDILGAVNYLKNDHKTKRVCVAAYSFGARVFLGAIGRGLVIDEAILISPPVSFMDFSTVDLPGAETRIIVGEYDDFCHKEDLDKWLGSQEKKGNKAKLTVLPNVDHFYGGAEGLLSEAILAFFSC